MHIKKIILITGLALIQTFADAQENSVLSNEVNSKNYSKFNFTPKYKLQFKDTAFSDSSEDFNYQAFAQTHQVDFEFKFQFLEQLNIKLNIPFENTHIEFYEKIKNKRHKIGTTKINGIADPILSLNFKDQINQTANSILTGLETLLSNGNSETDLGFDKTYAPNGQTPYNKFYLGLEINSEESQIFGFIFSNKSYLPKSSDSSLYGLAEFALKGFYKYEHNDKLAFILKAEESNSYYNKNSTDENNNFNNPVDTFEIGTEISPNANFKLNFNVGIESIESKIKSLDYKFSAKSQYFGTSASYIF